MSICIVSSYIDINRDEWVHFKRTSNDYIEGFKPYLFFNEDLIVFIDSKHYDTINNLVKESGKENICLISINEEFLKNNISSWSLIEKEEKIMSSLFYKHLTYGKNNPEHNFPKYNVIQHSKLDFIKYVIDNNLTNCKYICWSDFGFFMNSEKIPDGLYNKDLYFNLSVVDENRVNYCTINSIFNFDYDNIYNTLLKPRETIGGFFFIATREKHLEYNKLYKEVLQSEFYNIGITDDDQHVALRCYYRNPELFNFFNIGWHNIYKHFYNTKKKYTIVLPLSVESSKKSSYYQFIQIGIHSYIKHLDLKSLQEFIIVCPEKDMKYIQLLSVYYPHIPFTFYKDEEIVKEECSGWIKQQLIKLNISKHIKTDIYIPIDGDLILLKHLSYKDLFINDKIKYSSEKYQEINNSEYSIHSDWIKNSCKMLDYPLDKLDDIMSVTPQILYTVYVKTLINEYGDEFNNLFIKNKCTEFCLYWIYLLKNNLQHRYINCTYNNPLWRHDKNCNVLHYTDDDKVLEIVNNNLENPQMYFCVVQSWLNIDITNISKLFIENIVIICSIIDGSPGTIYSKETRINQTLETIITTKKKIPNAFIILEEISELSEETYHLFITMGVNLIFIQHKEFVERNLISPHKSMGEIYLINHALEYIENNMNDINYKRVFKIGGRNFLNDTFNLLDHKEHLINVKKNPTQEDVYTTLFSFGKDRLYEMRLIFNTAFITNNLGMYLENGLYHFLRECKHTNFLNTIGVSGTFSMTGLSFNI